MEEYILIELISGVEGDSVSINNMRICGSKPWGGGKILRKWKAKRQDIIDALGIIEQK
jgi:hypothetical protein